MDKKTTVDDRLLEMEAEAAQFINTDRLKALFRWTKDITADTNNPTTGVINRIFASRLYFFLWALHTIHKEIRNKIYGKINRDQDRVLRLLIDCNRFSRLDLDPVRDRDYLHVKTRFDYALEHSLYLYLCLNYLLNYDPNLALNSKNLYAGFYDVQDSSGSVAQFYILSIRRIEFVEDISDAKIFKAVDFNRIIQRYEKQRDRITAGKKGKPVDPSEETIHATWCSVLQITDEMLSMSYEEMEQCVQYLRAVKDIIDYQKDEADHVSSEVWNGIEARLLTLDAAEGEMKKTSIARWKPSCPSEFV